MPLYCRQGLRTASSPQPMCEAFFDTQLEHTRVENSGEGLPWCEPKDGNAILHSLAEAARQFTLPEGWDNYFVIHRNS